MLLPRGKAPGAEDRLLWATTLGRHRGRGGVLQDVGEPWAVLEGRGWPVVKQGARQSLDLPGPWLRMQVPLI